MTKVQKCWEVYSETQDNVSATQSEYAQTEMTKNSNMIIQGHSTPVEFLHITSPSDHDSNACLFTPHKIYSLSQPDVFFITAQY